MKAVRLGVAERRARLSVRHHLAPAAQPLAAWARAGSSSPADLERAVYDERSLVRILGMRRTMFVVPVELMPVVMSACTSAIAVVERRRTVQFLEQAGIAAEVPAWLAEMEEAALAALKVRGEALTQEIQVDEPRLAEQIVLAVGKSYEGRQSVGSRVLPLLAMDGRVVRARPRGSWVSGQFRWATVESWLPAGLADLPVEEARVALARSWLRVFGPAPVAGLKWWSGWTLGQTRAALAGVETVEVDLDGVAGLALVDDL